MIAAQPRSIGEIFDRAVTLVVRRRSAALGVAVIAVLPNALGTAAVASGRQGPLLAAGALLQILSLVTLLAGTAALFLLFGGDDDRPSALELFARASQGFGRYLGVTILSVLMFIAFAIPAAILWFAALSLGPIALGFVAIVAGIVAVPLFFITELAFAGAVLERTGAAASLGNALRRTLRGDQRVRTALLAFAWILCQLVPQFVISFAALSLVALTKQAWWELVGGPLATIVGLVFFTAVVAVAAIDYRVRTEGADLEATLDAADPA